MNIDYKISSITRNGSTVVKGRYYRGHYEQKLNPGTNVMETVYVRDGMLKEVLLNLPGGTSRTGVEARLKQTFLGFPLLQAIKEQS